MVNYRQSSAFDRQYLLCNDHCDRWLFQEILLLLSLLLLLLLSSLAKNCIDRS